MKLKVDEDGHAVVKDGMPVYVHDDGKEVAFDAPSAMVKISELNNEAKNHRLAAKEAREKLASFEGIEDAEAARKALLFSKTMEGKKAMDDESIKQLVENSIKPLKEELSKSDELIKSRDATIYKLMVSNNFASSAYLKEKTIFGETPDIAEAYFGKSFKIDGGKVTAMDSNGNYIYSRVNPGEPADFEEAISILVESHPKKDHMLKANGASGSGAEGKGGVPSTGKKRSEMSSEEKSSYISKHGQDAFRKLPA